ncbi:MAG TPA: CPBP family intramembrane glutamic endopeptidase [Bacteroidia bacterium]|jgi:membrane protease YdiL (CAAX protease family)|nr:CPBP family intramembrane glutamic endopeptidase [Bacteroidia bacterium]
MNTEPSMPSPSFRKNYTPGSKFLILMGLFILFYVFANIIGILCLSWIGGLSVFQMQTMDLTDPKVLLAVQVGQIIGAVFAFILPVIIYSMITSENKAEELGLKEKPKVVTLILGGILMLCAGPLVNYITMLNGRIPFPDFIIHFQESADKEQEAFLKGQSVATLILNICMIGILAAVGEELFFRSAMQKILIGLTDNVHVGILMTGIIFSAVHVEFLGFFPRMLMGMYLGYLFVWTKSIWVPMFVHFINNGSAVLFSFLEDRKIIPQKIDELGSDKSQIGYVMISTVIVVVLLFIIYRTENKKTEITA